MEAITKPEQVAPFAGQIVAYQSDYWWHADGAYENEGVCFGRISNKMSGWDGEGKAGYSMDRFVLPNALAHSNALIQPELDKCNLRIRLATKDELSQLGKLVSASDIRIEYSSVEKAKSLLGKSESRVD